MQILNNLKLYPVPPIKNILPDRRKENKSLQYQPVIKYKGKLNIEA